MIDDARLFAAQQEFSRSLALTQEAVEASIGADEGHTPPEHAMERAESAAAALKRFEETVHGLWFVMRRGSVHYKQAHRTEQETGREYRATTPRDAA